MTKLVLDPKTRDIIFDRRGSYGWGRHSTHLFDLSDIISVQNPKQLEEIIQTPLKDLAKINERLDSIGVLVDDCYLRESLQLILETNLAHKLKEYNTALIDIADTDKSEFFIQRSADNMISIIIGLAELSEELPTQLPYAGLGSDAIQDPINMYNELMCSGNSLGGLLEKMNDLARVLKKIKPEEENITHRQLMEYLNLNQLQKFTHLAKLAQRFTKVSDYVSLAEIAVKKGYRRPEVVDKEENCLIIIKGKWDKLSGNKKIIPNDTYLDRNCRVEVREGVNNGGKTYDMKKDLYIAALALSGMWVPADYAKISIRDKIILRQKGKGDSMSAMQQDCNNVKECYPPPGGYWLIGLDETFTSTERKGGAALTYGLVNAIADQGCSLLVASSHYLGLSQAIDRNDIRFVHFDFLKESDASGKPRVKFPHKKIWGPMDRFDYAITVAETRKFNPAVLRYARERLLR